MMKSWRGFARKSILWTGRGLALAAFLYTGFALAIGVAPPSKGGEVALILEWIFGVIMGLFLFAAAFNKLLVVPLIDKMAAQHKEFIAETLAQHKSFLSDTLIGIGKGFDDLMIRHINAGDPHPPASERQHGELRDAIDELERASEVQSAGSIEVSKRLIALSGEIALLGGRFQNLPCGGGVRDPKASAFRRRDCPQPEPDPPGADMTDLRGGPK